MANKSKIITNKELHCYVCKKYKNSSEFYKDKGTWRGYSGRCKKCNNTYERRKDILKRYRDSHPNELKAREAVKVALSIGAISRFPCAVCGEKKTQAHHYAGYAKKNWLVISWLCIKHHNQTHYGKDHPTH